MSSRLQDLLRERAVIQAHLAWLDEEIARAGADEEFSGKLPLKAVSAPSQVPLPGVVPASLSADVSAEDADAMLAEYQADPTKLRQNVRRGCLLYFCLALALLIGVVLLIHFNYSKNQ